jgi:hypothetical protein
MFRYIYINVMLHKLYYLLEIKYIFWLSLFIIVIFLFAYYMWVLAYSSHEENSWITEQFH